MDDRYMAWSLEEISQAAKRRQVTVQGYALEAVSPLNWYILLKAPVQKEPGRNRNGASRCGERNSGCLRIWQALAHNDK